MDAFADIEALEKRWRVLTEAEAERAAVLLADASAVLLTLLNDHGIEVNPDDEIQAEVLTAVCCNMVQRVMSVSDDLMGVKQYSQTAGSYSGVYTFATSSGDMYLTTAEMKWLGIKKQHLGTIRGAIHNRAGENVAGW